MSWSWARAVFRYTAPSRIWPNWSAPIIPTVSGVDADVHRHDIRALEQLVERASRIRRKGVCRDHFHSEPLEAPFRRSSNCPQANQPGRSSGELPGPEALIGDRSVLVDLARPHVVVRSHDAPRCSEKECDCDLCHGVGVSSRGSQHRDAGLGGGVDVDVVGVAPAAADRDQISLEHRPCAAVRLHDQQIRILFGRASASCSAL